MLEHDRVEDVCLKWDVLAEQTECQKQNTLTTGKIGASLSISQETIPTSEKTF